MVEENTGWQAALEIAIEHDKKVQRLVKAVLQNDPQTAQLLAEELKDEESGVDAERLLDHAKSITKTGI